MQFLRPTSWADALAARAEHRGAWAIAGGTDVMVALNLTGARPPALLDLTAVPELAQWERAGDRVRLGAAVPYARVLDELPVELPGLAAAARTVGSPQIRNRGTVGGNLGTASPAGDAHPPLLAADADVELASVRGVRRVPVREFFSGPRRSVLAPDELVAAVEIPVARGPQTYAKVGSRNAMVIAVCSFALGLDPATRTVGTGIGSAAPTPRRAPEAEAFLAAHLDWEGGGVDDEIAGRFGELVAAAAAPIDDVRGSAAYRRHSLAVLARRAVARAWAAGGRAAA